MPRNVKNVTATIEYVEDGLVEITLRNASGHPEVFHVSGIDPPLFIGLDGNVTHSLTVPFSDYVDVRRQDSFGPLLASFSTEK